MQTRELRRLPHQGYGLSQPRRFHAACDRFHTFVIEGIPCIFQLPRRKTTRDAVLRSPPSPWPERPIYGTIRSMVRSGMERNTRATAYIREIQYLEHTGRK